MQCLETEEEEQNSYNLDEITSQYIEDETTNIDCLHNKSPEKQNPVEVSHNTEDNCTDDGKLKTNFTKILDISHEIEKLDKSFAPSHDNDKQKRQKNKQ